MELFDSQAPSGRVLRKNAIFASPERYALTPWIEMRQRRKAKRERIMEVDIELAKRKCGKYDYDSLVRHITVNPDNSLYIYNVKLFESVMGQIRDYKDSDKQIDATKYWNSGILLSEWDSNAFADPAEVESWEVLVGPQHISSVQLELTLPHDAIIGYVE